MNKKPLVSFYILAYNHSAFIEDAIQGALAQTYSPLEIIISDDVSTDDTSNKIRCLLDRYKGTHTVRFIQQPKNLGIGTHINAVLAQCSGEWIVTSAGDDISEPNRVATIMDTVLMNKNIQLVQSYLQEIDETGAKIHINTLNENCKEHEPRVLHWGINQRIANLAPATHGASFAYSRQLLNTFPTALRKEVIFEDNVMNWRAELMDGMAMIRQPLVQHRNHAGQITRFDGLTDMKLKRQRQQLDMDSNIATSLHNKEDFEYAKSIGLINSEVDLKASRWLAKRHRFFELRRKVLLSPWPKRAFYFVLALARSNTIIKYRKREIIEILFPDRLAHFLIELRVNYR